MRTSKSTNIHLRRMIANLKKTSSQKGVKIWGAVADNLSKPARIKRQVNLTKLESYAKDGDVIVVPGKVLGTGQLTKKITVAAWKFSDSAFEKINKTGNAISLSELLTKNPRGSKVRIIG